MECCIRLKCCFCGSKRLPKNGVYHLKCIADHDKEQKILFYKEMALLIADCMNTTNKI